MKNLLAGVSLFALAGCSLPGSVVSQDQSTQIEAVLTRIGNTATQDLTQAGKTFAAETPPNLHGVQCVGAVPNPAIPGDLGTGALSVAAAIQRVLAVNSGQSLGAFTTAAVTTAFQPGTAQFNWALTQIETGCIALVHDENQAINSTSGIITALPSVLALAAAPVASAAPIGRTAVTYDPGMTVYPGYALVVRDGEGNVILAAKHADLR